MQLTQLQKKLQKPLLLFLSLSAYVLFISFDSSGEKVDKFYQRIIDLRFPSSNLNLD